ncbi:MAG: thioesterase domain-containing protein [Arcicella sp.]|jgi:surfactin synthase thioesterase subunit|nr:thioesterase domain-containing protein [Arcicella sp.]
MESSEITIYGFPFAAGSQYSYNDFIKNAPEGIRWKSLDYAGRGKRIFEPLMTNIHDIVADFLEKLVPNLHQPYAFYGHSMGSLVAYLLTVEIQKRDLPMPQHLFLSGRGGACIPERFRNAEHMTQQEIIGEILEMDGKIETLLQTPKLLNAYEKVLRADLLALEKYDYTLGAESPLMIEATVLIGSQDIYTPEQAWMWQKEFGTPIDFYVMNGGHFFLFDHHQAILNIIEKNIKCDVIT